MARLCCLALAAIVCLSSPAATEEDDSPRGVPYITLRDRIDETDRGVVYGDERSHLKSGWCRLDNTSLEFLSTAADIAPFHIPEEILRVSDVREEPFEAVLDQMNAAPVLYMHGYFIDFDKGCRRATTFKEKAGLNDRFLWLSWPSDGTLHNYARDEVNLFWSVPDFADVVTQVHERVGDQKLTLIGHSLGGRGVTLILQELLRSHPDLRLDNVVLLAPDMDFGLFTKILPRVRDIAERITLYTSDADRALAVSAQLHGYPRLGQSGNDVSLLTGVEVIDTSDLQTLSPNGHLYHIHNAEIGRDIDQLLNSGLAAAERSNMVQSGPNLWRLQPEK